MSYLVSEKREVDTKNVTFEFVNSSAIFFPFDYHISIRDLV